METDTLIDVDTETEPAKDPDQPLKCRQCGNPITSEGAAIDVEGLHEHVQANPVGMVFIFGCFRDAPGCGVVGNPTREHTWFSGHTWQFAICDRCTTHLGWYFRSSDSGFFGLILDRLSRG